jgi:ubiquinone/menaquinone biosynthesis C-methylase UbiE
VSIDFNTYAAAYQRNRSVQPLVLRSLVEGGRVQAGDPVLEVGCGTANYLAAIVAETGATGYGIDPAADMLAQARSDPARASLNMQVGSAESIPFGDGAFRFVFAVDVIHHVGDRPAFAAEAFRVLQPGGRICIATDSHEDIRNRVPLSSHFPETVPHELERYPAISTIIAELAAAGFGDVSTGHAAHEYALTDSTPYRERAFSALRLISDAEFEAGLKQLQRDLAAGPVSAVSLYTLVWAIKPEHG